MGCVGRPRCFMLPLWKERFYKILLPRPLWQNSKVLFRFFYVQENVGILDEQGKLERWQRTKWYLKGGLGQSPFQCASMVLGTWIKMDATAQMQFVCEECEQRQLDRLVFVSGEPRNIALIAHWDGWQSFGSPGRHSCGKWRTLTSSFPKINLLFSLTESFDVQLVL